MDLNLGSRFLQKHIVPSVANGIKKNPGRRSDLEMAFPIPIWTCGIEHGVASLKGAAQYAKRLVKLCV